MIIAAAPQMVFDPSLADEIILRCRADSGESLSDSADNPGE